MQSVSSNAVAESLSYVVGQEIKTGGKFFDGTNWKDVYKRIYLATVSHGSHVPLNISNLDNIIRIDGDFRYNSGGNWYTMQLNNPNDSGWYSRCNVEKNEYFSWMIGGFGTVNAQMIIEYTKTTD